MFKLNPIKRRNFPVDIMRWSDGVEALDALKSIEENIDMVGVVRVIIKYHDS